ncbi:hypothetical protein B0T14DRAFT_568135 [Immersiella caudata]|uniref:Uncharacterized protein n=1 Tax=Immersiella caudata TaxID=314043 RepID=A0AA39WJH2_9PEZI|nr:hypothetical protein B0T14DRAFT_568135 [Immersiella caudata]
MHLSASLKREKRHEGHEAGGYPGWIRPGGNGGAAPIQIPTTARNGGAAPTGNNGNIVGGGRAGSTPTPGVGSGPATPSFNPDTVSGGIGGSPQATGGPGTGGSGGSGSGGDGSGGSGTGSGGSGNGSDPLANNSGGRSGLSPGATAGLVVGLLALLALLALLLFKFRKTPLVQRILSPFTRLFAGSTAAGVAAGAATVAATGAINNPPPPSMRETGAGAPMTAAAIAATTAASSSANPANPFGDHNRIPTPEPVRVTPVSTASPMTAAGFLSPAAASVAAAIASSSAAASAGTSRNSLPPPPTPPKDYLRASSMSHASMVSTHTGGSAVMSPSLMSWPMPPPVSLPMTPPTTATSPRTPKQHTRQDPSLSSSQWISMEQPGETVVRINHPRRLGM